MTVDLNKMAESLASSGVVISLDCNMWDGNLAQHPEWGMAEINVVPQGFFDALKEAKKKVFANLYAHSIECDDGRFVPHSAMTAWNALHSERLSEFVRVRELLSTSLEGLRATARSAASLEALAEWSRNHPDGSTPPPSVISYASNLASSLVPKRDDLYDSCRFIRRINSHSFAFVCGSRDNYVDEGEKRLLSWMTVDELVAGNARRFARSMELVNARSYNRGKKVDIAKESSATMTATDMMPRLGLTEKAKEVAAAVEGKTAVDVDWPLLEAKAHSAMLSALSVSSVSGVMGRICS